MNVFVPAALVVAAVGGTLDRRRSARDNQRSGKSGWTIRPFSWAGFATGLPFYLVAILLLGLGIT